MLLWTICNKTGITLPIKLHLHKQMVDSSLPASVHTIISLRILSVFFISLVNILRNSYSCSIFFSKYRLEPICLSHIWFMNTWLLPIALKTLITWVSLFIDCVMTRKLTNCNAEKPLKVMLFNVRVLAENFVVSLHCVKLVLDVG